MKKTAMIFCIVLFMPGICLTGFAGNEKLVFDTQDFAPFSYMENKKISGPGADIIDLVCRNINVDYELRLLPWARAQDEIKCGQANALFLIGKNKEREKWLDFGPPIINTEYGFFTHKENKTIHKTSNDFANYTIGVYGPSNTATALLEAIKGVPDVKVEMTPDDIAAFKKLDAGRIGAVYSNIDVGNLMIKNLKLENIRHSLTHKKIRYYIGFSKEKTDKALTGKFYYKLIELQQNGEIAKILKKYDMK